MGLGGTSDKSRLTEKILIQSIRIKRRMSKGYSCSSFRS